MVKYQKLEQNVQKAVNQVPERERGENTGPSTERDWSLICLLREGSLHSLRQGAHPSMRHPSEANFTTEPQAGVREEKKIPHTGKGGGNASVGG